MMRDRKILFISSNFPPVIGGSAVVYDQLCKNANGKIVALGASRDYRTGEAWQNLPQADAARGYTIHRLPYLRPREFGTIPTNLIERVLRVLSHDLPVMARAILYILFLLVRYNVKSVCLGELIYGGWMVFPLRYVFGRSVFLYTHGEEIAQDMGNILARRRGLFLRHATSVIAVSEFCKGQLISKCQVDPNKIFVLNNGVDLTTFCNEEQDRSIWPEAIRSRKIILSVSRLVERKGQETLIKALPKIIQIHPEVHCFIVGGGPLENRLRSVAAELGVTQACTIAGQAPQVDVVEYFRNCDLFVLPCHTMPDGDTEGFGLVFLEACACRKPVVAGIAGGTVEAVADEETGLLVDGSDTNEVADAVIRLLSNPEFASQLASAGWQRAQKCSWRSVTRRFLDICSTPGISNAPHSYRSMIPAFQPTPLTSARATIPKLLVTVDVEEEFEWDKFNRHKHSVRGLDGLQQFHRDCESVGVSPVYLLTYPILMNEEYRNFFRVVHAEQKAEIGIHLHSWTSPPHWEDVNAYSSYQCNLPEYIERRKLETLCRAFESCFGESVSIHRAGRWGGGERTSDILEQMRIAIDLSPSIGYSDASFGGPNFANLDGAPFWSGRNGRVLTIPASSVNYLRGPRWVSSAMFELGHSLRALEPHLWRKGKAVRLSPENADEDTLIAMVRELGHRGSPTAVYSLHSTSLYSDGNPYSTGMEKVAALRQRSLNFFRGAFAAGLVQPTTCAELLKLARTERANNAGGYVDEGQVPKSLNMPNLALSR
jgi:glycosyltransferase involved in cell wall biosynthesis